MAEWLRKFPPVTVRFWIYENGGWVKLALMDGDAIYRLTGGPTDEGYHREGTTWSRSGGMVYRSWWTDGRDCDGRYETEGRDECPITELRTEQSYDGEVDLPNWGNRRTSQRDHTAEAAGY